MSRPIDWGRRIPVRLLDELLAPSEAAWERNYPSGSPQQTDDATGAPEPGGLIVPGDAGGDAALRGGGDQT
ncbi:hypothetical protein GEV33_005928 [Tenebrio molitor]|uniref:Uncharacterized protein n=1 Tax=Tenebrio molitor TaxID=7067 RepID=A0A8J6LEW5_TENMO|nr:hypothetical protein GEV33_005928 [Tenebrio molitor]